MAEAVKKAAQSGKKRGKKYRAALAKLDRKKLYTVDEAIKLLAETSTTKFDSTAEVHMNLGLDPKQSDQMIRGTLALPHGTGQTVRVIAFVDEGKVKEAKAAGAVDAGSDELIEKINKGWLEFDVAVATPDQMKKLGKVAKTLGQKGLMPNPKAGTVTTEPAKTIEEIKKGRIEYKLDKEANVHNIFGRVSFGPEKLAENLKLFLKTIQEVKPAGVKGNYINSITVTTTMGPGIKISASQANA
jgi:large subunit ribosomal protein L1